MSVLLDIFNSAFLFLTCYLEIVNLQIFFINLNLFENQGNNSVCSLPESKSLLLT